MYIISISYHPTSYVCLLFCADGIMVV